MSVVKFLHDHAKNNAIIYCNMKSINPDLIPYKYINGLEELLNLRSEHDIIIFFDEIFTEIMKGDKLTKPVLDFLCQMRKRKIIFLTTCQEWAELPLTYRRFCRYQIDCKMKPFFFTGFLIKTFKDAENMKWSNDEQEHVAPIVETTITKCRKFVADSYDTFLRISSLPVVPVALNAPQGATIVVNEENGISQT